MARIQMNPAQAAVPGGCHHPSPLPAGPTPAEPLMFLGRSHLPAVGLGFLALAGAAVSGFPVYPRSCAGGWREVGAGGEVGVGRSITGAKTSPGPYRGCGVQGLRAEPQTAKGFLLRAAPATRW